MSPNFELYEFQKEAIESWQNHNKQGTIILPTGSGKTIVALGSIVRTQKKTLIIVPTLALLEQWKNRIHTLLEIPFEDIGEFGGGKHDIKDITIITYDSAYLYVKRLRLQFGLLILDEAHHLAGPNYQIIADAYIAPHRLGLTATLDIEEISYSNLMTKGFGPIVYQKNPDDLKETKILSEFKIVTTQVKIDNIDEYKRFIKVLQDYIKVLPRSRKLSYFQQIIFRVNRDHRAQEALQAYRKARDISFSAKKKLDELEKLLVEHKEDKMIIFSDYVAFCEKIARTFFIPCITHRTSAEERRWILEYYKRVPRAKLVTSKILDEGVDVPDAKIAVIMISSGSKRQFIQRLGRILRRHPSKDEAILYEIVSEDTLEERLSKKRKKI
jgi:superfamily II DNA or RNA helicase